MNKRLQVFISSTFDDLREERNATIEAILKLKHIPAGMESFTGEREDQLKIINEWIDASDIFLLIIGVRYGTLRKGSEKSYTHLEYEHAVKRRKPMFVCVMSEDMKVRKITKLLSDGKFTSDLLNVNADKLRSFREEATKENRVEFNSIDNLQYQITATLNSMQSNPKYNFIGWIRGDEIVDEKILSNVKAFEKLGINKVYTMPSEKPIKEIIPFVKEFYSIAYVSDRLFEEHRDEFRNAFENGAIIHILVGTKGSDFIKEIDPLEDFQAGDLSPKLDAVERELRQMVRIAKKRVPKDRLGKVEIRSFNTEFRNAVMMYKDKNSELTAHLTVMFAYKRAGHCMMIEFNEGSGAEDCRQYFDRVWELRADTVVYNSDLD